MTGDELLTRLRTRETAELRTYFPALSERELMQIFTASPQHAVYILQQCFGGDAAAAKAAWNDYVLRYVDGRRDAQTECAAPGAPAFGARLS